LATNGGRGGETEATAQRGIRSKTGPMDLQERPRKKEKLGEKTRGKKNLGCYGQKKFQRSRSPLYQFREKCSERRVFEESMGREMRFVGSQRFNWKEAEKGRVKTGEETASYEDDSISGRGGSCLSVYPSPLLSGRTGGGEEVWREKRASQGRKKERKSRGKKEKRTRGVPCKGGIYG